VDYIEIKVSCDALFRDILIAEMGEIDFDSFVETEVGFDAYIIEDKFSHPGLQQLFNNYRKQTKIWYELKKIPKVNWNEEWEKNYDPIQVGTDIYVRAIFHEPRPEFKYEIVINPKMSFGTGHHETTHQLLALQLAVNFKGKTVLDVGSGTGILAIMAHKLGASEVSATDIDDWCIENATENFGLNEVKPKYVEQGVIKSLGFKETFDIVLANINKNVLLDEMDEYARLTRKDGYLFLSGFYAHDEADILERTSALGFTKLQSATKREWTAVLLQKAMAG
jgi:ribosomal protein L11 methyltransferase